MKEKLNPALTIFGILSCRVNLRTKHAKEVLQELKNYFKEKVFQLAEAPLYQKPIIAYADSSSGAKDYRELADEVIRKKKVFFLKKVLCKKYLPKDNEKLEE